MSAATMERSVDFLLSSAKKNLQLHFFGAEPLVLPIRIYREILPYARRRERELGKNLDIIVTTNGTLLDEQWLALFRKHGVRLEISLDGDAESHNRNRPQRGGRGSYSSIVENFPLLFDADIPVSVTITISPETVGRVYENFLHLVELGFQEIFMMVATCVYWPEGALEYLRRGLRRIEKDYPTLSTTRGLSLLNLQDWVWPMRMNTELSVDSDGRIGSACAGFLAKDPALQNRCGLARIETVRGSIDDYQPWRLSNTAAMGIVFREADALHTLPSCIRAGAIMADFVRRLGGTRRAGR